MLLEAGRLLRGLLLAISGGAWGAAAGTPPARNSPAAGLSCDTNGAGLADSAALPLLLLAVCSAGASAALLPCCNT